jgi:hypothetical protein
MDSQKPKRLTINVTLPGGPAKSRLITGWKAARRQLKKSRGLQLLLVLIVALLPSLYFYHKNQQTEQKLNGSTSTNLQTTAEVVKRVGRHILLPSGEQPTVATVSDASKVRNQAFFANAANGDKVLVYAQAKKAYLYRPSIDRVIEVAPLAPSQSSQ